MINNNKQTIIDNKSLIGKIYMYIHKIMSAIFLSVNKLKSKELAPTALFL